MAIREVSLTVSDNSGLLLFWTLYLVRDLNKDICNGFIILLATLPQKNMSSWTSFNLLFWNEITVNALFWWGFNFHHYLWEWGFVNLISYKIFYFCKCLNILARKSQILNLTKILKIGKSWNNEPTKNMTFTVFSNICRMGCICTPYSASLF